MSMGPLLLIAAAAAGLWLSGRIGLGQATPENGPLAAAKRAAGDVHYTKLVIAGDPVDKGIYDPSIAFEPDGSAGWLAYSSVSGNGNLVGGKLALGEYISTHIARTTDSGKTWTFVKAVNIAADGKCTMPDAKEVAGVWRYEVPSLVCDAADPNPGRRWKLFSHCYFWDRNGKSRQEYAWIALRTAPSPAGPWSAETPLLGAGKNPPAPYHNCRVDVNDLDKSLKSVVVYTEPGALAHGGKLYLSLTALQPQLGLGGISINYTVILLASEDHGDSWKYAGPLLTANDAHDFGHDYFDGTDLAEDGGRIFLLAVPGSQGKLMHDGCVEFEFESLEHARLRRDAAGRPVMIKYFAPQPSILSGPGAGQSTYDAANVNGGLHFNQFNLHAYPEVFQIYQTGQRLLPGK